jgi:hypothetical protein
VERVHSGRPPVRSVQGHGEPGSFREAPERMKMTLVIGASIEIRAALNPTQPCLAGEGHYRGRSRHINRLRWHLHDIDPSWIRRSGP